jgi:hypothetical protein
LLFFSLLVHNASLLGKKNERHGRRVWCALFVWPRSPIPLYHSIAPPKSLIKMQ